MTIDLDKDNANNQQVICNCADDDRSVQKE